MIKIDLGTCDLLLKAGKLKSESTAVYFSISILVTPCNQDLIKDVAVVVIPAHLGFCDVMMRFFWGRQIFCVSVMSNSAERRQRARISLGDSNDKVESTQRFQIHLLVFIAS